MKDFIDYCMKGMLNEVIILFNNTDILNKALEYYPKPHSRKYINKLCYGISRCIVYKHYDMAIYLMSNYCVHNCERRHSKTVKTVFECTRYLCFMCQSRLVSIGA